MYICAGHSAFARPCVGVHKETVAAIAILYRNTKVKVRSPDGDTEYFDIVAGVLQGDLLAPYLFIICLDYILRKNQNGFRRNRSTTSQILTIRRILEGVRAKNLQATLIFVDFTKAFDSIDIFLSIVFFCFCF